MSISRKQYRELLKENKWKHKAKEIRARDGNKCVQCGAKGRLQVHHLFYVDNKMPWDYPNDAMVTLCSVCHRKEHGIEVKPKAKKKPKPVATKQQKKRKLIKNKIMVAIQRTQED
jgi:5-methylcytosine-specific restriction endonuclease McrA